jgi:hypothetical protein
MASAVVSKQMPTTAAVEVFVSQIKPVSVMLSRSLPVAKNIMTSGGTRLKLRSNALRR